uniref:Cytochrome c biogenesis protein Ccs1 n=1 Tax=Titanophycus setchellii TaxID=940129 RepID=A0A1G4NXU0_9FLOR|nr:Cytochrome c biogenesis protein ccs1 [Titanophycus setchellii]SCW23500.1 Cytochrome c biogenesis protein ccs1 [Titanophycus setchellii]
MRYKFLRWKIIKILGNLNVSISLLLLIALISVIGTIIEQNQSPDYYQIKYPIKENVFLNINWLLIQKYHLNEIFISWQFLCLILLFSFSLIICTFSTQLPSLKNSRRWKMKKELNIYKPIYKQIIFLNKTFCLPVYALTKSNYYTFYQKDTLYSYKGLYGRIAPIAVHFSIIVLLFGTLGSVFSSFYIQTMVPVGETFALHNVTNSGIFSRIPDQITGQVTQFQIEYYPDSSIKQFRSSVELYNHKTQKKATKIIKVNEPMKFDGLTIYQTDWQINGIRMKLNTNTIIQIPLTEIDNNSHYWFTSIVYKTNKRISLIVSNPNDNIKCYDDQGQFITTIDLHRTQIIDHIPVHILSILTSTGLQIKVDYGVNLIYTSFGILMLSVLVSYLSFSQVWISCENNMVTMGGHTNRASLSFEEDIFYVQKYLSEDTSL